MRYLSKSRNGLCFIAHSLEKLSGTAKKNFSNEQNVALYNSLNTAPGTNKSSSYHDT